MRHVLPVLFAGFVLASATLFPAGASTDNIERAFVYTWNQSEGSVWVTAYGVDGHVGPSAFFQSAATAFQTIGMVLGAGQTRGSIQGAWCVAPNASDKHGLTAGIFEVRAQVYLSPNCRGTQALDEVLSFSGYDPAGVDQSKAFPGVLHVTDTKIKPNFVVQEYQSPDQSSFTQNPKPASPPQ
jgi:hypothetical protein